MKEKYMSAKVRYYELSSDTGNDGSTTPDDSETAPTGTTKETKPR